MNVIKEEQITHEGVFWLNFVLAIMFNFFGIFPAGSKKYLDDCVNKLKWLGYLFGFIVSAFVYGAIGSIINGIIILGIILIVIAIVIIIVIYKLRVKIYAMAGHVVGPKLNNMRQELVKEMSDQDYQIRYRIEYGILRNLIMNMEENFKKILLEEDKIIDFLCDLYINLSNNPSRNDFSVYYNKTNDEKNIILKLPETDSTALCNMIGIKVESKRFFAYSDQLVEWKNIENPIRLYLKFDGKTPEELLHFISNLN